MPIYEFQCPRCSKRYEMFLSFSEYDNAGHIQYCPYCKSAPLKRIFVSAFNLPVERHYPQGLFDPGIGRMVYSESERRQAYKDAGLVQMDIRDLPSFSHQGHSKQFLSDDEHQQTQKILTNLKSEDIINPAKHK